MFSVEVGSLASVYTRWMLKNANSAGERNAVMPSDQLHEVSLKCTLSSNNHSRLLKGPLMQG